MAADPPIIAADFRCGLPTVRPTPIGCSAQRSRAG